MLISKKWTGLIVNALLNGECHFCDLERAVPSISARLLSLRLKELEQAQIISRKVDGGTPVRVSYSLTNRGRGLSPIISAIAAWAHKWNGSQ